MSEPEVVKKRLEEIVLSHESVLAGLTLHSQDLPKEHKSESELEAALALRRSQTSNPPLTATKSSITTNLVCDLDLNPDERVAPSDLLSDCLQNVDSHLHLPIHLHSTSAENSIDERNIHASVIKAITVFSTLLDEAEELHQVAHSKFFPQLILFGHDLKLDSASDQDELEDPEVLFLRDEQLLERIGAFISNLMVISNFSTRIITLIRNLVCQLGGCFIPISGWGHDDNDEEEKEEANNMNEKYGEASNESMQGPAMLDYDTVLLPVGEAIAKLLSILLTLDSIISKNSELHEAWDLYKVVVAETSAEAEEEYAIQNSKKSSSDEMPLVDFVPMAEMEKERESPSSNKNDFEQSESFSPNDLAALQRMLNQIDSNILSSRSYLFAIEQNFDKKYQVSCLSNPQRNLHVQIHQFVQHLCSIRNSRMRTNSSTATKDLLGVYSLYGLYRRLLPNHIRPDENLHCVLSIDLPGLYPTIPLFGNIDLIPAEFIARYTPLDQNAMFDRDAFQNDLRKIWTSENRLFDDRVWTLYNEALDWLTRGESKLAPWHVSRNGPEINALPMIENVTTWIMKGKEIANRAVSLLRTSLMQENVEGSIGHSQINGIIYLCCIVKSIEQLLRVRKRGCVVGIQRAAIRMVTSTIFGRLEPLRCYVDQFNASSDCDCDIIESVRIARVGASLSTLESLLKGSSTFSTARRYAIDIAIYFSIERGQVNAGFSTDEVQTCSKLLHHLSFLSNIDKEIIEACDCSFLYFRKDILPLLVKQLYYNNRERDFTQLQLLAAAFSDPACSLLRSSSYVEHKPGKMRYSLYMKSYRTFLIDDVFCAEIIRPICESIENDLRLHVFAKNVKEMKTPNPKQSKFNSHARLLELPPFSVCDSSFDIKHCVQRHLERSFYNFSTVGLQDSQTYAEMSLLAKQIYQIELVDSHLPACGPEQGIDLMQVSRDLDAFVSGYNYNTNQQNFIERQPKEGCRFLNTIGVEIAAFSLKRHGMDMIQIVNKSAFKSLSKAFNDLSRLFLDEYFLSAVSKERRWFDQQKTDYPYDRGVAFSQEIASHGDEGVASILDRCKFLITCMGNVLGLTRLVRTGQIYAHNQTMQYATSIPSTFGAVIGEGISSYKHSSDEHGNKQFSFDVKNFNRTTHCQDFLQSSVDALKQTTSKSDHSHLDAFYIIFPALSLAWLDNSLRAKEMLVKKFKTFDSYYTDDGFAMGSAFLFTVLHQNEKLDGLNWFESFRIKFAMDRKDLLDKANEVSSIALSDNKTKSFFAFGSKGDEKDKVDITTSTDIDNVLTRLRVTAKRLEMRKREMEMLHNSLHGARLFFKGTSSSSL